MLKIGSFAGITGLSVKALRHYDDTGVLTPHSVDGSSGYRWYAEEQVRAGVVVRALRSAGVALAEIHGVTHEADALGVLERSRAQVLAEREAEDRAYRAAAAELRALAAPVHVDTRPRRGQRFVGCLLGLAGADSPEPTTDEANAAFADLYARLAGAGAELTGAFWTTMRTSETGAIELLGCWEVSTLPDGFVRGPEERVGALGAGQELVATWTPVEGEELGEDALHPAVVALFDRLGALGIELGERHTEIRQTVLYRDQDLCSVEVAVTLPDSAGVTSSESAMNHM